MRRRTYTDAHTDAYADSYSNAYARRLTDTNSDTHGYANALSLAGRTAANSVKHFAKLRRRPRGDHGQHNGYEHSKRCGR